MSGRRARATWRLAGVAGLALLMAACGGAGGPDAGTPAESERAGQSGQDAPAQETSEQLTVDGRTRTYELLIPQSAPDTAPVVVVLHDAGGTPESIAEATQLNRSAREHGFAVAYPAGLNGTWNAGFCCGGAPAAGVDDMAFLDALIGALADREGIDAEQVYLAGVSNGSVMAYRYACQGEEAVAGLASVAGTMAYDECEPQQALSVLEMHGTEDQVVPVDGGELADFTQATRPVPSAEEVAQRWADLNGCDDAASRTEERVTTTTWPGCRDERTVRLIVIEGAGHTWYAPGFGEANGAIDATATLVDFFGLGQSG